MNKKGKLRSVPAKWLLKKLLPDVDAVHVIGDIEETFQEVMYRRGTLYAKLWYLLQLAKFFQEIVIFNTKRGASMFKNYFKVAFRSIRRQKTYSFINIFGLAIGLTCTILIALFVQYETSYDAYHENADRIYRVSREFFNASGVSNFHGNTPVPLGARLKDSFPEIEAVARFNTLDPEVYYGDKVFKEPRFYAVDNTVFDMFSWKLLQGDRSTVLENPNNVVISKDIAKKYFDDENAMGKSLRLVFDDKSVNVLVTGVMENTPLNSQIQFDFLVSLDIILQIYSSYYLTESLSDNSWATYVLLPEGYAIENLKDRIAAFMEPIHRNDNYSSLLHFWKLTDVHLRAEPFQSESSMNITYIYIFSSVGLFVLLIAGINFMNLSTARAVTRAKEIGMRKVVGALKTQLVKQFLVESIVTSFAALAAALVIMYIVMPYYKSFTNLPLTFGLLGSWQYVVGLAGITIFVGLFSGIYPAFVLSTFRPVGILGKSRYESGSRSMFRTILVITQFAVSIIMLINMNIVYRQMSYIKNKKLGFNEEQLVYTRVQDTPISAQHTSVRSQLLDSPNISAVSFARRVPSGPLGDSWNGSIASGDTLIAIDFRLAGVGIDHQYMKTFGIEIVAGRDISEEFPTDEQEAFLINETAARRFGWANMRDAVDKPIRYAGRTGKIVGVVKDFHFESMHKAIDPIVFFYWSSFRYLTAKISTNDISGTLSYIANVLNDYKPGLAFDYKFIDESFENLYHSEERLGQVFGIFSGLAVFVACLGLFGLAAFTSERRAKEISIRKVLGASMEKIVVMLSRDFTRWVLMANLFAWPLSYYIMNIWMERFAYRAEFSFTPYLISAAAAFAIALLTVSFQTFKAAIVNPASTLRND